LVKSTIVLVEKYYRFWRKVLSFLAKGTIVFGERYYRFYVKVDAYTPPAQNYIFLSKTLISQLGLLSKYQSNLHAIIFVQVALEEE